MWVRKRLDIRWSDLGSALRDCLVRWNRPEKIEDICELWSPADDVFVCLSVRTGFDLWLQAADLPPGSEVLVSAITIRDMVRIIEAHGLVAVPVDLNADDLSVNLDSLRRAITPKTKAILVAHLFGTRQPLEGVLEIAREHGLLVAEDCAQAFAGRHFTGHPEADVSMFSFGSIKTATALGGAVLTVRNPKHLEAMHRLHATYPVQRRTTFAKRVAKYALMKLMSYNPQFGALVTTMRLLGRDPNSLVTSSVRGFPGPHFFPMIRKQPSAPLLALLYRRIAYYHRRSLVRRTEHGKRLLSLLRGVIRSPGSAAQIHSYWVFPVLHHNAPRLIARLQAAGFDASAAHSLCVVPAPEGREECHPATAAGMLPQIVHLPCYPEIPDHELRRMAEEVRSSLQPKRMELAIPEVSGPVAEAVH